VLNGDEVRVERQGRLDCQRYVHAGRALEFLISVRQWKYSVVIEAEPNVETKEEKEDLCFVAIVRSFLSQ
jgi:hypothetical protein